MKLLAVETATEACSAALIIKGEIKERWQRAPREHTRLILPMVDSLMEEAGISPRELDALAFGCGPGSFTGVRIATGVAHGIALGVDLPVLPISTLAALAQDYFDQNPVPVLFTAMDARMGELFWGVYRRDPQGFAELLGKEMVGEVKQIEKPPLVGVGIGSGWSVYGKDLADHLGEKVETFVAEDVWPKASAVARLGVHAYRAGKAVPVEMAQPVYLRDKVAKTERERSLSR